MFPIYPVRHNGMAVIQIEKCQGKQTNINTWSNSRSEVKTNEMPDAVK
jgi:hypothetical protein